jgi:hypothetical protein
VHVAGSSDSNIELGVLTVAAGYEFVDLGMGTRLSLTYGPSFWVRIPRQLWIPDALVNFKNQIVGIAD